jgi:hypothetical protein
LKQKKKQGAFTLGSRKELDRMKGQVKQIRDLMINYEAINVKARLGYNHRE